jgi:hypothetical protein
MIEVVQADARHIPEMAPHLRQADLKELKASGSTPVAGLSHSLETSSKAFSVLLDGEPIAMFGVSPMDSQGVLVGALWLMGTPGIEQIRYQFLRESKQWLAEIADGYDFLANYVHEDNHLHIRWLRWLGAAMLRRNPPFLEFVIHV